MDYLCDLLNEAGRLGLSPHELDRNKPRDVTSDLLAWHASRNNDGFDQLYDWRNINAKQMESRLSEDRNAKPRIELTASISIKYNLSVVWHPKGWKDTSLDWSNLGASTINQIKRRKWESPPDFLWFTGDEEQYFDRRASNELMYIRNVGSLNPEPRADYGVYSRFNHDVVDSILICAVRAAYEGLIQQLEKNFEVTTLTSFDFESREEDHGGHYPIHRVIGWQLERTDVLLLKKQQADATRLLMEASTKLQDLERELGITAATVGYALKQVITDWKGDRPPSMASLEKHAVRHLRSAGYPIDERDVRQMLRPMKVCKPDLLPAHLLMK